MRALAWMLLGGLLLVPGNERGLTQEAGAIDVQVVKYDGLKEAVLKNRGKVVVVDFWATWCVPCLKAFPHMVEMQQKYRKDGLVLISVSLDQVEEKETPVQRKERVLVRLRKLQANINNVILDEKQELVSEKLRIESIPHVYVFNRQEKWTQFSAKDDGLFSPTTVEKLVVELLQEK